MLKKFIHYKGDNYAVIMSVKVKSDIDPDNYLFLNKAIYTGEGEVDGQVLWLYLDKKTAELCVAFAYSGYDKLDGVSCYIYANLITNGSGDLYCRPVGEFHGQAGEFKRFKHILDEEPVIKPKTNYLERELDDNYPLYLGYWYVVDGTPQRCLGVGYDALSYKTQYGAASITTCDIVGRGLEVV